MLSAEPLVSVLNSTKMLQFVVRGAGPDQQSWAGSDECMPVHWRRHQHGQGQGPASIGLKFHCLSIEAKVWNEDAQQGAQCAVLQELVAQRR